METIGVCLVFNEDTKILQMKSFVENLLSSVNGAFVNYYILSNNCSSEVNEYLVKLADAVSFTNEDGIKDRNLVQLKSANLGLYESYNYLMQLVKEDYICLIPNGIYLNKGWHVSLIHYCNELNTSGIVSINSGLDKTLYTSVLSIQTKWQSEGSFPSDKMMTINMPNDYIINGLYFMRKQLVHFMGGFDCNLVGYEREELCWRSRANGLNNYYVLKDNCIDILLKHEIKTEQSKELYLERQSQMTKNKIYKKSF